MKEQVEPNIENSLKELKLQIDKIDSTEYKTFVEKLLEIIQEINIKEEKLDALIEKRNELQELKNQLRRFLP